MTEQPPPPSYTPPPGPPGWTPGGPLPPPPNQAAHGIPWWRRAWVIPVAVGLIALFVGIGLGASGNSTDTRTVTQDIEHTVTVTETPEPITTTETATRTLRPLPPTATVTKTIRVTPTPKASLTGDGVFLVGKQIQPGTYQSSGGGDCYWARLSGFGGSTDDIISNGLGAHQIVTISSSDKAFDTERCGEWTKV